MLANTAPTSSFANWMCCKIAQESTIMNKKIDYSVKTFLTSDEFAICKDDLKKELKDNLESLKNVKLRKEESNSFKYQNEDLANEIWKQHPGEGWRKYKISNLGRVKFNDAIVPQKDDENKGIGYLVLDKEKFGQNVTKSVYVYRMVAETFLGKITSDGYSVHHITNNGYDNSLKNLILLTSGQHRSVHMI